MCWDIKYIMIGRHNIFVKKKIWKYNNKINNYDNSVFTGNDKTNMKC